MTFRTRPCCANHGCQLNLTNEPNIGICPVSGAHFDYEADPKHRKTERVIVNGQLVEREKLRLVKGNDI